MLYVFDGAGSILKLHIPDELGIEQDITVDADTLSGLADAINDIYDEEEA